MQRNWRELIKPKRLAVETKDSPETYAKFTCEPLERGFGTTLGNSLRRILLSSLQGAAITSVKIGGVLHEFSTIPGVIEDVTDVILNLKEIYLFQLALKWASVIGIQIIDLSERNLAGHHRRL